MNNKNRLVLLARKAAKQYFSPLTDESPAPTEVPTTFTTERTKDSGHLIHKLKAKDSTGRWAYYFILVEQHREADFLAALQGDSIIDLEEYGRVVASCYGEEPNLEVREYMKGTYGFDV